MKIFLGTFVLSFFFLAFSFGETDASPNSQKELEVWLPLRQKEKASYPKYLNALIKAYCELPPTDKKAGELKKEIEQQHPEYSKNSLTVSYYERHSFLANAIMPNLYNDDLNKDRAEFFVKLLKPSFNTKTEDFFIFSSCPLNPRTGVSKPHTLLPTFVPAIFPPPGRKIKSSLKKLPSSIELPSLNNFTFSVP